MLRSFMNFYPNYMGSLYFKQHIHRHFVTGVIHGVCTPIAAVGVFMIIHGVNGFIQCKTLEIRKQRNRFTASPKPGGVTKKILYFVLGFFACGYMGYSPKVGALTLLIYWYILSGFINKFSQARLDSGNAIHYRKLAFQGFIILSTNVAMMEFIGHWLIERQASDVTWLANSVYHTPLYGVESILGVLPVAGLKTMVSTGLSGFADVVNLMLSLYD